MHVPCRVGDPPNFVTRSLTLFFFFLRVDQRDPLPACQTCALPASTRRSYDCLLAVAAGRRAGAADGKSPRPAPQELQSHRHLLVALLTGGAADEVEMRKAGAGGVEFFDATLCCEGRTVPTVQARTGLRWGGARTHGALS